MPYDSVLQALVRALTATSLVASAPLKTAKSLDKPLPFFIDNESLGAYYPYTVHIPEGTDNTSALPALMFLHGTGSRGEADMMDELCTWNGIGRRLKEYQDGDITISSQVAATQFLSIMPIAPNETTTEWHIENLQSVLDQVQADYGFDETRVYLTGYSMGARDGWKWILEDDHPFAAAAFSAGEPEPLSAYGNLTNILNLPVRHYQGAGDFVSTANSSSTTQALIAQAGGTECELITLPGVSHNRMADAPFYDDLWRWLLSHSKIV